MNDLSREKEPGRVLNFRQALKSFFVDAAVDDSYFQIELSSGKKPDQINSQVCHVVQYETIRQNNITDEMESQIMPKSFKIICGVSMPPILPFIRDEDMPDELSAVVKSNDPDLPPLYKDLRCVELSIIYESTFADGTVRKSDELYRVDLTKPEPIAYRREPIPVENQQPGHNLGEGNETTSAIINFLEPPAAYTYKPVDNSELQRVTEVIMACRNSQHSSTPSPTT